MSIAEWDKSFVQRLSSQYPRLWASIAPNQKRLSNSDGIFKMTKPAAMAPKVPMT